MCSRNGSASPCCSHSLRSASSANARQLVYLDDAGNVQGPFSEEQMREWHAAGLLPTELKARDAEGDAAGFVPIALALGLDGSGGEGAASPSPPQPEEAAAAASSPPPGAAASGSFYYLDDDGALVDCLHVVRRWPPVAHPPPPPHKCQCEHLGREGRVPADGVLPAVAVSEALIG